MWLSESLSEDGQRTANMVPEIRYRTPIQLFSSSLLAISQGLVGDGLTRQTDRHVMV
jgi:hypothetical protein